jgi:hypothetical protein
LNSYHVFISPRCDILSLIELARPDASTIGVTGLSSLPRFTTSDSLIFSILLICVNAFLQS